MAETGKFVRILTDEQIEKIRGKFPVQKLKPPKPKYALKSCMPSRTRVRISVEDLPTYVYFIQGEQSRYIKIGYTHDLASRMASFQLGAGEKLQCIRTILFPDQKSAEDVETKLHKKFASFRLHGEWFLDAPDLMNFINTHQKNDERLHTDLN